MSIYSDYAHGAMDRDEFRSACAYENRRERYYDEADSYDGLLEYYEGEEEDRTKVYIAGPVTGRTDYEEKFAAAEQMLLDMGYDPYNPVKAGLVEGWEYRNYINRGLDMLMLADEIYMLPDWESSPGARLERMYAEICGLKVTYGTE